ncbi:MAG: hypothetical protein M1828_007023 [Chrysothrix sp. TS-e1954]|nr:MAG: hypothetical protein M1828_007023 [Chrysothrix sp. TS-e1954]
MAEEDVQQDFTIQLSRSTRWMLNGRTRIDEGNAKFYLTIVQKTSNQWLRATMSWAGEPNVRWNTFEPAVPKVKYLQSLLKDLISNLRFCTGVTNICLRRGRRGRLTAHVTNDQNEVYPYPSLSEVKELTCVHVQERDVHLVEQLSGFTYRVCVAGSEKFVKKEMTFPDMVPEFLHEIHALYRLRDCPHVIDLAAVIIDGTVIKSILVPFARDNLFTVLSRATCPSSHTCAKWAQQLLSGVSSIHELGITHRGITLKNIVIDDQEDLKIIDFMRPGTPIGWTPPELLWRARRGEIIAALINSQTDMYQVGMVLWAIITKNATPEQVKKPLQLTSNVTPSYLAEWTRTCLSEDPADRVCAADLLRSIRDTNQDLDVEPDVARG